MKLLPVVNAKVAPVHASTQAGSAVIEIVVGAATVRLRNGVDAEALRTVLDCLAPRA